MVSMTASWRLAMAMAVALTASCAAAQAQDYPVRPVQVIVPAPAGGASDILTRLVAEAMRGDLGQNVIVDNKAGGGGTLGLSETARAAPDGYTIGFASHNIVIAPLLMKAYTLDPVADFKPVAYLADTPFILVTRTEAGIGSVAELIAHAKALGAPLNVGMPGTAVRVPLAAFAQAAGIEVEPVIYQGSTPMLQALASGELDVALDAIISSKPFIEGGTARVIAVGGEKRFPSLPDVPTMAESGIDAGDVWTIWYSLVAPPATPDAIVERLGQAVAKALQAPEVQARARDLALNLGTLSRDEFAALIASYRDTAKALADQIGMVPE